MARRKALTMLSLVGALLLTAVVPLSLITTSRERASFRQDTVLTARASAALLTGLLLAVLTVHLAGPWSAVPGSGR